MLDENIQAIKQAALQLRSAKKVLISTGAGMSADSNIPTYRDKFGRWREFTPFVSKGLTPEDFANPLGYRERPQHAWAFHEWLRRIVANNEPHQGYAVLARWLKEELSDAFVLTTNVDGYHLRSGVPEVKLCERYGSQWELQCLRPCQPRFWSDTRVPLCALNEEKMEASGFPTCPYCGGATRPRVLMSHDQEFIEKGHDWKRYENFKATEPDLLLVIGTTLWFSWPEGAPRPQVISINPDPETHAHYEGATQIKLGAQDALLGIDWMLRVLPKRQSV